MVSPKMPQRTTLLPRGRYRLVLSAFPGLKKTERLRAVEFRLPELYPGSMEDILWESRLLPGPSGAVLSVITPRREIEEYRRTHPESRIYIPLLHCIDLGYPRQGQHLKLVYGGSLTDTLVRDTNDDFHLSSLPEEPAAATATADRYDPDIDNSSWRVCSPPIPAIKKKQGRNGYRGAFAADRIKGVPIGIRAALLCAAILCGLAVYGERLLKTREAEFAALSRVTRDEGERINTMTALKAEIKELETRLTEAETAAHIDPWLFLNRLAPLIPRGARIQHLSTQGDSFTLELSGGEAQESALGLGEALFRESGFADIVFQEVRFLQNSSGAPPLPRYRLTGSYYSSSQPLQAKEEL